MNDFWKFNGVNWTWISGSNQGIQNGVYGSKGVPDKDNTPGSRRRSVYWKDSENNFYLFGGWGLGKTGDSKGIQISSFNSLAHLNDLWVYNGVNWTWISGSDMPDNNGDYGSIGVPDKNNIPCGRYAMHSWKNSVNNIYIFGGAGYGASGSTKGRLNDFWKFNGVNWTWMDGAPGINDNGFYSEERGILDESIHPSARSNAAYWVDSDNNFYLFGGYNIIDTIEIFYNDLWKIISTCYGYPLSKSIECSGRGKCIDDDVCNCTGAIGKECETPLCFGIPANDLNNVCNGNGDCLETDKCICKTGWDGLNCSIPYCYGKTAQDPSVCSGHGLCITKDLCECKPNWYEANCNVTKCFGIFSNDSNVCNGRGACVNPDECKCELGWGGDDCAVQVIVCFEKNDYDPEVCSGHGDCVANNTCECKPNWYEANCNVTKCFGILGNDINVCNGHGACVNTDECVCDFEWEGEKCDVPQCYGKSAEDTAVCSGHGNCIDKNICQCEIGWEGSNCNIPQCFGKSANDTSVCSENGICVEYNKCKCNSKRIGEKCEKDRLIIVYATANVYTLSLLCILILILLIS